MPQNDMLSPQEEMVYKDKFTLPGSINFVNQLEAIKVTIIDAPTIEQFRKAISVFMLNSWSEQPQFDGFTDGQITTCIRQLFNGEILPTGQEIIGITWCVEGLDLVDVTHLIRHRSFSFSAQCSDRDLRDLTVLVKPSIMANEGLFDWYKRLITQQHSMYKHMMDYELANVLDARAVLPISKSHFYNVRCCIRDLIAYCNQRSDEQIQPQTDNIVALKLWLEVVRLYPFLKGVFDPKQKSKYYIDQCIAGKTTLFPPNENNDVFEYSSEQFFHSKHRDEFPGGDVYIAIRDAIISEIEAI